MEREYVGIDLHRRRSVIVRKNAAGELLSKVRIENSPMALAEAVAAAGPEPEVVLEATFGWYWAADVLEEMGARVHLAHPLGNNWGNRRVKNDERDANDLVDLLRLGRLAEAWIAPPELRELREVVRYRLKLVRLRGGLKAQVHAVMGKHGVLPSRCDMFYVGGGGPAQLDALELPAGYMARLDSLRDLIEVYDREINDLDRRIPKMLANHQGYRAIQAIHGVGPILAAVFVAEIGDVTRFPSPAHLASWAGMTPTHRESDTKVRRGKITKQGSRHVRWAAVEAVSRNHGDGKIKADYRRISELPERLHFHSLRHTCAAFLIADGRHMEEVKDHLGHSSIRVTSDRYGHLFPKARQAVADSLDGTFRRAAARPAATEMRPTAPVIQFPNAGQGPQKGP